jgi:lipoate-protein ligase B
MLHALLFNLGRLSVRRTLEHEARVRASVEAGSHDAVILMIEHDPAYTVGRAGVVRAYPQGDRRRFPHVRAGAAPIVEVDRGGDVTWHGPGQLVIHPVLPLKRLGVSLTGCLRLFEGAAIDALGKIGVSARRRQGFTGVWVGEAKLGFIGVACRKWVTYHGMSLNVDCDLSAFAAIVPCGIEDCQVTSLAQIMARPPAIAELGGEVARALARRLGIELREAQSIEQGVSVG